MMAYNYILILITLIGLACNVSNADHDPLSVEVHEISSDVRYTGGHAQSNLYDDYPGRRSTLSIDIREFAADIIDSAIVDIVLTPRVPDTLRRAFVFDFYRENNPLIIKIPIIDSIRRAKVRVNALGYKGSVKEVRLVSDETTDLAVELWPMYPDSAQKVIKQQYDRWVQKESDKMLPVN